jgi:hypothetical protein
LSCNISLNKVAFVPKNIKYIHDERRGGSSFLPFDC